MSESLQVSLLALFYPELIDAVQKDSIKHMVEGSNYYDFSYETTDPEDVIDDLLQTIAEQAQSRYGTTVKKVDTASEIPVEEQKETLSSKQIVEAMYEVLTLEELITKSICSIKSVETRKKMASKILLVGGTV